jgi:hypothetical protein
MIFTVTVTIIDYSKKETVLMLIIDVPNIIGTIIIRFNNSMGYQIPDETSNNMINTTL